MAKVHGFKNVQKQIAQGEHIPMGRAAAILAVSSRKASKKAKKANPNLKKVKGGKPSQDAIMRRLHSMGQSHK